MRARSRRDAGHAMRPDFIFAGLILAALIIGFGLKMLRLIGS